MGNYLIIPLTNDPNQNFVCTIPVDGKNIDLAFNISYNAIAKYWVMRISDAITGKIILDSIPLVTGEYPSANLLEQYSYLGIGSAILVKVSNSDLDFPDDKNLGNNFLLAWGDTIY